MLRTSLLAPLLFGLAMGLAIPAFSATESASAATQKGTFLGAKPTTYPDWFKESFLELEEDVAEAAESGKRLIVLFHQDGCPYCNALVERNLSQKDIETELREHFEIVAINMWGDRDVMDTKGKSFTEKDFATALKVQFTPTLLFFDTEGQVALRLNGYIPPDRFKQALAFMRGEHHKQLRFRDYVAQQNQKGNAAANKTLNTQPYFASGEADLSAVPEGQVIALFFEQKDCPQCDALHQGPLSHKDVRETASQMHCQQLDMWSETPVTLPDGSKTTARQLAADLDVKYAPSIVLLDHQGKEIIRNEAEFKTFHTQGILEYARSGDYRDNPSFQRWLDARAHKLNDQGIDVNLWE